MFLSQSVILGLMLIATRALSLFGIIPQIILNYKSKSIDGLSKIFLFIYLIGYSISLLYVYGLNLPIIYKIATPVSFLLVLILVFQRFLYSKNKIRLHSVFAYSAFFLLFFLLIILTVYFPKKIGNLAGWVSFIIWFVYLLPQMFRIYLKKSVEGFSFLFVFSGVIASSLELIVVLVLGLPIQSIFINVRGIVFFSIFCLQFWMYRKKPKLGSQKIIC